MNFGTQGRRIRLSRINLADQLSAHALRHLRESDVIRGARIAKIEIRDRINRNQMEMRMWHLEPDDGDANSAGAGRLTNGVRHWSGEVHQSGEQSVR